MLLTCPRCNTNLDGNKIAGDLAVCSCGWHGSLHPNRKKKSKPFFTKNKKSISSKGLLKFSALALSALAIGYGSSEWKGFLPDRVVYNIKSSVKLNSAMDEFHMAVICHKLQKQNCKEMSLANAYKKDSQNVELNGEYAISLTESQKHDQAILAFQKFFANSEGNWRHQFHYAQSLGAREYFNDAKEWYYKAIKANPSNLEIAESMMNMLTKSFNFGEALSIIGHFNMTLPQTQKTWHNLAIKIKTDFKEYQEKYAVKNMTVSKIGSYFFAPAIVGGAMDIQLFIVNPESVYTTVDLAYLKSNGIPFENKGDITVTANNGQSVSGTKVIIPSMIFGAFSLKNIEAVACDNCAFLAGKTILSKLAIETSQLTNAQVNILSMSEK
jgi:tetratricopeptide (TPR) repeat protein